jgi:hypothetical protein
MAQFVKNYVQDLAQDIQIRHCGTLIFNADTDSNVINVSLYNGQEEAPQSGSVACAVICSDGSTVPVTGGTISGNTVSVTLGADGLIPGQVGIGIQVISGDVKTTVFKAVYSVELFETDTVVDPSSRITISVGELVSDIEAAVASIPADYSDLLAAIAPTFSTSTAYASGSYVWYSGHLYRFTAAHSAGAWVGTDAVQVALADDVSDLKSALSEYANGQETANPGLMNIDYSWMGQNSQIKYYSGESVNSTITENTGSSVFAKVAKIPVSGGEQFIISADGGSGSRAYYVIDSSDTILSLAPRNAHYTNAEIPIDEGASFFIVQAKYATNYKIVKKGNLESELQGIDDLIDDNNKLFEIDYSSNAEINAWYTGTTIGGTLSKTIVSNTKSLKIPVTAGDKFSVTCAGGSTGRAWYTLDNSEKVVNLAGKSTTYEGYVIEIQTGIAYLLVQTNDISKFGVVKSGISVETYDNAIDRITFFSGESKYFDAKLAMLKATDSGIVNIAFIGDSWTQGTQDSISSGQYETYVKWLSKSLWQKYGFAGLGWLDFARDNGENKMFGCADLYEHWTYSFSGTVTGLDGSSETDAPDCLGICCAHSIFSNGASLTLNFDAGYLDTFYLRYYKNAHFTVSVNGGTATEITANGTDGWQETLFGTTGTDTTTVVITSLADNTIIFGMDCYYGTKGIRCHKVGNRSLKLDNYLLMNETQFETGISLLGISWASILFAINDLGSSIADSRCLEIVSNYTAFINRLKVAYTNNGIFPVDIAILGCDEIESASYHALPKLESYLMNYALNKKYSWCSTKGCIGSNKNELDYTGLFSDQIHLNKAGSMLFAGYIYEHLFKTMGL